MNMNACKNPIKISKPNGISGATNHGTSVNKMIKNRSSPLMFPNRRNESEMIRERCDKTSTINIIGASANIGPKKCLK